MSHLHFTLNDRIKIEVFIELGYSYRKIGKFLEKSHTSISREVKRNKEKGVYNANIAENKYKNNKSNCGSKGKYNKDLSTRISAKLNETFSPEQIENYDNKALGICFKTIYRWLYDGKLDRCSEKQLRHKGKRRKPQEIRGKFLIGTSISKRPTKIKRRTEFGHFELDTMVSSRGKSKGCFATFCEMKSRFYFAIKIPDRTSESFKQAINKVLEWLPRNVFKSFTSDRGKEFACYPYVEDELKIDFYFADPYCAWQRGSNENSNGLLREFYPKQTDLATVNEEELAYNLFLINNRPRKCLGWKSSFYVFYNELVHLT